MSDDGAPPRPGATMEVLRFLVSGAINTGLTLVLYQILLLWLTPTIAYTVTFTCGILLSAVLYSRFVFATALRLRRFLAYGAFYLVSYAIGLGLLTLFVDALDVDKRIAIFLVIAITTPINFAGSRVTLRSGGR